MRPCVIFLMVAAVAVLCRASYEFQPSLRDIASKDLSYVEWDNRGISLFRDTINNNFNMTVGPVLSFYDLLCSQAYYAMQFRVGHDACIEALSLSRLLDVRYFNNLAFYHFAMRDLHYDACVEIPSTTMEMDQCGNLFPAIYAETLRKYGRNVGVVFAGSAGALCPPGKRFKVGVDFTRSAWYHPLMVVPMFAQIKPTTPIDVLFFAATSNSKRCNYIMNTINANYLKTVVVYAGVATTLYERAQLLRNARLVIHINTNAEFDATPLEIVLPVVAAGKLMLVEQPITSRNKIGPSQDDTELMELVQLVPYELLVQRALELLRLTEEERQKLATGSTAYLEGINRTPLGTS